MERGGAMRERCGKGDEGKGGKEGGRKEETRIYWVQSSSDVTLVKLYA